MRVNFAEDQLTYQFCRTELPIGLFAKRCHRNIALKVKNEIKSFLIYDFLKKGTR